MSDDFQFPKLHVTRLERRSDGDLERVLVSAPTCDFCMDLRVLWQYDCAEFSLADGFASTGPFASCDPCSKLIEERMWMELTGRIYRSWQALGVHFNRKVEHTIDDADNIVTGFIAHRIGQRELYTED